MCDDVKGFYSVMNLQRISAGSAAPLGFTEFYNKFQCLKHNLTVLFHFHCSHSVTFSKQQTDTVRGQLVNTQEHLAAKEQIFTSGVGGDKNGAKRL